MMVMKVVKQTPRHIVLIHASTTQYPTAALTIIERRIRRCMGFSAGFASIVNLSVPMVLTEKDSGYS
jgi:hypothetical protein